MQFEVKGHGRVVGVVDRKKRVEFRFYYMSSMTVCKLVSSKISKPFSAVTCANG
jgi:hypothetical protein